MCPLIIPLHFPSLNVQLHQHRQWRTHCWLVLPFVVEVGRSGGGLRRGYNSCCGNHKCFNHWIGQLAWHILKTFIRFYQHRLYFSTTQNRKQVAFRWMQENRDPTLPGRPLRWCIGDIFYRWEQIYVSLKGAMLLYTTWKFSFLLQISIWGWV